MSIVNFLILFVYHGEEYIYPSYCNNLFDVFYAIIKELKPLKQRKKWNIEKVGGRDWNRTSDLVLIRDAL